MDVPADDLQEKQEIKKWAVQHILLSLQAGNIFQKNAKDKKEKALSLLVHDCSLLNRRGCAFYYSESTFSRIKKKVYTLV